MPRKRVRIWNSYDIIDTNMIRDANLEYSKFDLFDKYNRHIRHHLISTYGDWIKQFSTQGWDGYFVTIMFHSLPGSNEAKIAQMDQDVMTVYGRLATRVVRKPSSSNWKMLLPRGIFVPDLPVPKTSKNTLRDVRVNDGLHMHGVIMCHRWGRMRGFLDDHFEEKKDTYQLGNIRKIHVERITSRPQHTADYAFKGLKRSQFSTDHVLILPQSISELPDKKPPVIQNRAIKDIQAAWNVSDEVADKMLGRETSVHR
jgi:hypothetical protein